MKPFLETDRIVLRPVEFTDADDIFEYAQDEETGPRAGWPPHKTIEDTLKIIEMWVDPNCKEKNFAIVYKPDNKVIGTIGYTNKERNSQNSIVQDLLKQGNILYEIGIVVSKKYWGQGVATESLNRLLDYLFEEQNADIVVTCHAEANIGSGKMQEKCNMKYIGCHQTEKPWYNTDNTNHIVRAKTRSEWQNEKNLLKENI